MGAGVPNFQRLAEMGKLPKDQHGKLPHLAGLDESRKELNRLREGMCDECHARLYDEEQPEAAQQETSQIKCDIPGCFVMVGGKSQQEAQDHLTAHKTEAHPVGPPEQTPAEKGKATKAANAKKKEEEEKKAADAKAAKEAEDAKNTPPAAS